jgi:putative membrane protein
MQENKNSMHKKPGLYRVALFITLLVHVTGIAGMLFAPYKDWFVQSTSINLCLMTALLILTHPQKDKSFYLFVIIVFIAGFMAEVAGVNTGSFFGRYSYSSVLGIKLWNVPLVIGVNWFIVIYCTGIATQAYENYMLKRINDKRISGNRQLKFTSFIVDACFLILLYDWILEPVAIKLGYWQWENEKVPLSNYVSWVILSALLLAVFRKLNRNKQNIFAVNLFLIQVLFFLILRTFL